MRRFSSLLQTFSITLLIGLALTISLRAQTSPWPYGPSISIATEEEHHEEYDPEKNPWWKMSPEGYARAIEHLMGMRDERDVEWARGKRDARLLANNRWEAINPGKVRPRGALGGNGWTGRVRSIRWAYNTTTRQTEAMIGASSGGLWVGEEDLAPTGLRYWRSLGDNLPNPAVGAFLVNPYRSNEIWVATGDWARAGGSGLYKTTDRGATWTRSQLLDAAGNEIFPGASTAIFYDIVPTSRGTFTDTNTLYLSTSNGVFKSTDRGTSWRLKPVRTDVAQWGVYSMVQVGGTRGTIYAALPWGAGIYRTTNGGDSWTPMNTNFPTTNMGSTLSIDISQSNTQVLYAGVSDTNHNARGIWKTTNGGTSWSMTGSTQNYMRNGQGTHVNCIKIHYSDPNIVYAGSVGLIRTSNGGTDWTSIDGGHADLVTIAIDPFNPNLVYLGNDGGIFVRNESGNSVSNAREVFTPAAPIQAYGMDYAWGEPGMTIVGTQDNGTFRNVNASSGRWEYITDCDGPDNISIDPTNGAVAYFNGWCGPNWFPRWRVTNRGNDDPINVSNGLFEIWMTPIQINKLNTNFPFTVDTAFLYYSSDRGDNWPRATSSSTRDFSSQQPPRGIALNVGSGSPVTAYVNIWPVGNQPFPANSPGRRIQIAEGTPGSMTWRSSSLPGNEVIRRVVTDRWDPEVAYAFTDDPAPYRVYRTLDRGRSWRSITGDLPTSVKHWDIERAGPGSTTLYLASDVGIFKTRDTGRSWYKFQYGLPIVGVGNIDYIPSITGNRRLDTLRLASFGRGMWQRVLQWEDPIWLTVPFYIDSTVIRRILFRNIRAMLAPGIRAKRLITLADSGRIYRTINGGLDWSRATSPTNENLHASASIDEMTSVAVGEKGTIVRTIDGGETWYSIQSPVTSTLRTIAFGDNSNGIIAGDDGVVLTTNDGGESWYSQTKETPGVSIHSVHMTDRWNGWLTGVDGTKKPPVPIFRRTTDGGDSWTDEPAPNTTPINRVLFLDGKTGFAVGPGGWIGKTSNGGSSWETKKTPSQLELTDIAFATLDSGWAVGEDGTIVMTTDGGETWEFDESGTEEDLRSIALSDKGLVAVGDSVILLRLHGANRTLDVRETESIDRSTNLRAYPNPTHGAVSFTFTLATAGHVRIEIFDAMGRRVAALADGTIAAGAHHFDWNVRTSDEMPLPPGTYYCRLTTSRGIAVARVVAW